MEQEKDLIRNKVTICIINYKTEELIKLCLRSIRHFTKYPYEVIVVDNDSKDSSVDYLRSLDWITLIERHDLNMKGGQAHSTALDIGLENCKTEYFLSMHSDTIPHRHGWLQYLVDHMGEDCFCTGCGKIDLKPNWVLKLDKYSDIKGLLGLRKNSGSKYYIRTICGLYRTEVLLKENQHFMQNGKTSGKDLYHTLIHKDYKANPIDEFDIAEYIYHLSHATMVLNKEEFKVRLKTRLKYARRLKKILNSPAIKQILEDNSLDK
jgi:glycosyltransferase involved in cell wall biosynthesis